MERTKDAWFNYSDAIELMPLKTTLSMSKSQRLIDMQTDIPALKWQRNDEAPNGAVGKKFGQISDTASGNAESPNTCERVSNSTGGRPPERTGGTFGATVKQPDNRYSDYRRTAKAASRFWRGSTKGAA